MTPFTIDTIARVAHEVNRAYCRASGDESQPHWWEAPEWQRESVRAGVRGVLDGTYATAEQQHAAWLERKERDGWRYGRVKDVEAKLHPAFVPWSHLPREHRIKADLCRAVCTEVALLFSVAEEVP